MWDYWIKLYIETWCVARGLRPKTLIAYEMTRRIRGTGTDKVTRFPTIFPSF